VCCRDYSVCVISWSIVMSVSILGSMCAAVTTQYV